MNAFTASYNIGSSKLYKSPTALTNANVLKDGDSIFINGGTYSGNNALANWKQNNLYIAGKNSKAIMKADGKQILGKGIWVLSGNNIKVYNIEFTGAVVNDHNGAGIRLDGNGMHVNNCSFHHNENGILISNTNAGTVIVENSELYENGYGDGLTHNIYCGYIDKLIFQGNYSHHAKIGHCLKSRAKENQVLYNRIRDEQTGTSSRLIDIPNGGKTLIKGNVLTQGPNAQNNNLIGYGLENYKTGYDRDLYITNNTMINYRKASCIFVYIKSGANTAQIINNIMAGKGDSLLGTATLSTNNFITDSISKLQFVDEFKYNYSLQKTSPAIDQGMVLGSANGLNLSPMEQPTLTGTETRVIYNLIDIGAIEFESVNSIEDLDLSVSIYPNPSNSFITIKSKNGDFQFAKLIDLTGRVVLQIDNPETIDITHIEKGIYTLILLREQNDIYTKKIIKN